MIDPPWLRLLIALGALVTTCGCSALDNCPDAQDDIIADNSHATIDTNNLIYDSAPWDGPLQAFPAKTQVIFKHDLGVVPDVIDPQLSFSPNGTNGAAGGSVTPTAGNETAIECVDSDVIIIKNDTCERSFFIRVHASGLADGVMGAHTCGGTGNVAAAGGTNKADGSGGASATEGAAGAGGASNN
jgi:hypothetical protein